MTFAYREQYQTRIERQKTFFSRNTPGDLLVYVDHWCRLPTLDNYLMDVLEGEPLQVARQPARVREIIRNHLKECRDRYASFYAAPDDMVPGRSEVFCAIGAITAAMTGKQALIDSHTTWCELELAWDEIAQLRFDPDNEWIQFALELNNALWEQWEEDFLFMPYCHRSPLDAANGIRGTQMFIDMYEEPEQVHALINWCADWSIQVEQFLDDNVQHPRGLGRCCWGTWLPDGAIWVNGDPVGMITRAMQPVFDAPYTGKLFSTVGGGFFHHHAIGLHQVDQVVQTAGICVQEIYPDPNVPHPVVSMLSDPEICDRMVQASLVTPIMLDWVPVPLLDELLPRIAEGRFILALQCFSPELVEEGCRKVRKWSNLD